MKLSKNAEDVARKRYFMEGEDWEACCRRVAGVVSQYESSPLEWAEKYGEIMFNGDFIPGGRVLRNAGRPRGSLFNCYLLPISDSIEAIGDYMKEALILWSEGGGVGTNFSSLRPKGTAIRGKGGRSSGLVSFMRAADGLASTIESGGQRRAAAIAIVDVHHPEVLDFIDAKLVHGILSHFNISVSVSEDFLEAVEEDREWTFTFEGMEYGKTDARKIWKRIVDNMVKSAEPGLINWNKLRKNNSYSFSPILGTNPCGEVCLGAWEACNLGSLTLPHFLSGTQTNWKKLAEAIELAVRFLDNIIDMNRYSLIKIEQNEKASRRVGLGTMGLADYLFGKRVRYGSPKATSEIERLYKFIRDKAYETSIKLAEERGTFPKYEKTHYSKATFIRKLPATLRLDIKERGIRNCTLLSQAPTGTISLIPEVVSGIEPLYSKAYKTNDRAGIRYYIHPLYKKTLESGVSHEWFVDSSEVTPVEHFEVQVACQKYTDSSVSKTINMPKGTTSKQLSKLLLEYIWDLKGVTVYVDGCRGEQPLVTLSEKEALKHLSDATADQAEEAVQCAKGTCDL